VRAASFHIFFFINLTIDLKMSIDIQRLTSKMSEERSKLSAGETLFHLLHLNMKTDFLFCATRWSLH
jgi:hypothetical protein